MNDSRFALFCSAAKPFSPVHKQFLEKHFNANYPPGLVATDMTDRPQFANTPDDQWVPIEKSGELVFALVSGITGRIVLFSRIEDNGHSQANAD